MAKGLSYLDDDDIQLALQSESLSEKQVMTMFQQAAFNVATREGGDTMAAVEKLSHRVPQLGPKMAAGVLAAIAVYSENWKKRRR